MDSSSDGSFAWTDASNDSIDSEPMVSNTMNKPNSEDESVSGKTYKKKLQEELFSQSNENVLNDQKLQRQNKERKRKYTETHSENENVESPKKRKIKREPESDIDVSTSKHKINGHYHSESHDSYDESYLKLKVKTEKQFLTPSPVTKNRSKAGDVSENVNEESFHTNNKKSKKQTKGTSEETEVEDDILAQLVQEENKYHEIKLKKKKKSKKRKDSTISNETQPQESHMDEDVSDGDGRTSPRHFTEELDNTVTNVGQPDTPQKDKKAKSKNRSSKCSTGEPDNYSNEDTDRNQQPITPINKSVTFQNHSESVKRTQSISERIQFEEDDSSDVDTSQLQSSKPPTKSSKLKMFLNDNPSLKPFTSRLESDSVLTVDDEVWIVRCPKDVDIEAFQNKDFTVEGKCKVKLNGQTYEGAVDDESGSVSILSSEQSNFIIKSLTVRGCLHLRKRIPKCHFQNETMVNNQGNFIPLPETKCRHPLFGSNYRKAIKLPASVAERLKLPDGGGDGGSTYKKKRKSQKGRASPETVDQLVSTPKAEPNPKSSVKPEVESDHTGSPKKKKKKRKHSDSEEIAPKKKRIKHNLESAEAWESEQAIEENLFTF